MTYIRYSSKMLAIIFVAFALYLLSMRMGFWNPTYETVKADYADLPSQFVDVGDVSLHMRDEGAGPVIIMLHSSQTNLRIWDAWVERLKGDYRIIRLDWPPYGLSIDPKPSAGSKALVPVLHQFIQGRGLEEIVFAGSSSGATLSVLYAAAHPENVKALALSALPLAAPPPADTPLQLTTMNWMHRNLVPNYHPRYFYKTSLGWLYGDPSRVTPEAIDLFWATNNLPGGYQRVRTYYQANLGSLWSKGAGGEASRITVPVLLQWGDRDPVLPKNLAADAVAKFVNAPVELIHYSDVGHYPMLEVPERTAKDLETFLTGVHTESLN